MALEDRRLLSGDSWLHDKSGDWDTASNWSTGQVPSSSDDVTIDFPDITVTHLSGLDSGANSLTSSAAIDIEGGDIQIANSSTIDNTLTISNAALFLTGTNTNLTVSKLFTWSGGTVGVTGTLTASGGLAITGSSGDAILEDGTLDNAGAATWTGSHNLSINSGAVFDNQTHATFTVQTDATINASGGTSAIGTFKNEGTFTKETTTGTTVDDTVPFDNTGTVDVTSGKLVLDDGGTSTGAFNAAGAAIDFAGVTLGAGSTVDGGPSRSRSTARRIPSPPRSPTSSSSTSLPAASSTSAATASAWAR
jgi:hypothetical protein